MWPDYIADPELASANALEIRCGGIDTELKGGMLVDADYYLEGEEASTSFFLIPSNPTEAVPYSFASFVADCIAFEHMVPTLTVPRANTLPIHLIPWVVKPLSRPDIREVYLDYLAESVDLAETIASGIWQRVVFAYGLLDAPTVLHKRHDLVHLDFSARYGTAALALHLFNAALRQADPLAQFLNYYRVIENLTPHDGTAWIEAAISTTLEYKTTILIDRPTSMSSNSRMRLEDSVASELLACVREGKLHADKDRWNLTELLRSQALTRINQLTAELSDKEIASRLYGTNRCGIAHGRNIRRHDLDRDFEDVMADLPLMAYLARLAIEECTQDAGL